MPMKVGFIRQEVNALLPIYYMIKDCIDGEPAIKGWIPSSVNPGATLMPSSFNGGGNFVDDSSIVRARRYLPMPNASDQSPENKARYLAYLTRAVFWNATARTLSGAAGQIFLVDPVVDLPTELEPMEKNTDGNGLDLVQVSKRLVNYTMAYGRCGILTDYPEVVAPASKKDLADGKIKPLLKIYAPWNIINWQIENVNGNATLTMIVLREAVDQCEEDDFEVTTYEQIRYLYLDDVTGFYNVETYKSEQVGNSKTKTKYVQIDQTITPKDSNGQPFTYIPFQFVGSEYNDFSMDKPPMYDIASLNIAHYRNSADYEESCYQVGQPTFVAIGISEDWFKNVLKGVFKLGSQSGIPLPTGADAKLIQASPNTMPLEAMKLKEDEMVALGAKLVTQKRVQRTATESVFDASSEQSVLTNVANNVSSALTNALTWAADFVGAIKTNIKIKLNTSFELNRMTADDISKLVANWQKGAIAFSEMRDVLRSNGIATMPDDEAKAAIKQEQAEMLPTLGPVADPFGNAAPAAAPGASGAPNPNSDPKGHSKTAAAAGRP